MRPPNASSLFIAFAALAIGRFIESPATPKTLGVDSPIVPPEYGSPDLDAPGSAPALGGMDFDPADYAKKELWDKYLEKGDHMMCLMEATDRGAGWLRKDTRQPPSAASRWTGDLRDALETWYWHDAHTDKGSSCDFERMGLKAAFEGLGLNSKPKYSDEGELEGGDNDCFELKHYDENMNQDSDDEWGVMVPARDQHYYVGQKKYSATAAFYVFAVNIVGGAIIAQNIESPRNAVLHEMGWGRAVLPGELPELQYASDVFWGYWFRDNPNIRNLRIYAATHVINEDTRRLVARALKNVGVPTLKFWPGTVFLRGTEEFRALIGSPIGATAGNLLTSHKAELGIKRISKVTVLIDERKPFKGRPVSPVLNIFFSIEDVPPPEVTKPDEKPDEKPVKKRGAGQIDSKVISVRDGGRNMIWVHTMMA